jgi:hypothetical protein
MEKLSYRDVYRRACGNCRQRKIRCLTAAEDTEGRCVKCIISKRDCIIPTEIAIPIAARRQERQELEIQQLEAAKSIAKEQDERGRTQTWGRAISPTLYSDNESTRLQSPASSVYHDESPLFISDDLKASVIVESDEKIERHVRYQYIPLTNNDIRLLRISLGLFESDMCCSLKAISLDKITTTIHDFQALSYAWGDDRPDHAVYLGDLPKSGGDGKPLLSVEAYSSNG